MQVYARIKPALGAAAAPEGGAGISAGAAAAGEGPQQLLQTTSTEISQVLRCGGNSMAYSFTRVFEGSDQEEFYGTAIEPLVSAGKSCGVQLPPGQVQRAGYYFQCNRHV